MPSLANADGPTRVKSPLEIVSAHRGLRLSTLHVVRVIRMVVVSAHTPEIGVPLMRRRNLRIGFLTLAGLVVTAVSVSAQSNPRFGVWQMQSDAPLPSKNIMTYEP